MSPDNLSGILPQSAAPADAASPGRRYQLFVEGDLLYGAMLESIARARSSVRLETYIFAADEVGWKFAEALAAKADDGVDVRVHIDAAGSLFWTSRRFARYLREHGVQLRWFHRWSWSDPFRYNRRNHRKLLVVDSKEAYLGGFNIHRENSRAAYGEERWRDTHVRVHGLLAAEVVELFDAFWHHRRGVRPVHRADGEGRLATNETRGLRRGLRGLYAHMIAQACRRIRFTTPYFVPDRPTQRALADAARRGVDVQLLLPRRTDVALTRWAGRAAYASLLAAGVRLYEYLPRVLHAKTATVDGEWALVGTANLDYRSFFVNYEVVLVARDPRFTDDLDAQFERDLQEAEPIPADSWRRRRWNERALELVGWAARRWL